MQAFEYRAETYMTDAFESDLSPLDKLGRDGWELVSVVPCPEAYQTEAEREKGPATFYFKRPLPEAL